MRYSTFIGMLALLSHAQVVPAQPAKPRLDAAGDPLPAQALHRFGTARFCTYTEVVSLALSHDAKLLAAADRDGRVYLWDADTGKTRFITQANMGKRVVFSPDGNWLALGEEGAFEVRNLRKDEPPRLAMGNGERAFVFSPDSKSIAVARADESDVVAYDIATGNELARYTGFEGNPTALGFSPDGKRLAAAVMPMVEKEDTPVVRIGIWDMSKPDKVKQLDHEGKSVRNLQFLADNKTLIAQVNVRLIGWDAITGKKIETIKHTVGSSYALDAARKKIATTDGPKVAEFDGGKTLHEFEAPALIRILAMSGDGKLLAACPARFESASPRIMLWDLTTDKERTVAEAHRHYVDAVAFAHDGKTIATASHVEGVARIWSAADAKLFHALKLDSLKAKESGGPRIRRTLSDGLAYSADRPELFIGGQRWDLTKGEPIPLMADDDFRFEQTNSYRAVFTPDARRAASFLNGHALLFWEPGTAKTIQQIEPAGKKSYGEWAAVAFHSSGKVAVTGKWFLPRNPEDPTPLEDTIYVWDLETGKSLRSFRTSRTAVARMMLSPDGETLAVIGFPTRLELWHLPSGRLLREMYLADVENLPNTVSLPTLAFAPHGQWIAFAHREGEILLLETMTGKEIHAYKGHNGYITALAFAPDSRRMLSGGRDTTALLWSVIPEDSPRPASWDDADRMWLSLGGPSMPAYRVVWALAGNPKKAIEVIGKRLEPDGGASQKEIAELVANLASPKFAQREPAIKRLKVIGVRAFPELEAALKKSPDIETTRRIQELLKTVETALTPETLRDLRALQVLEMVGTAETRAVIVRVAAGDVGAAKTRLAQAALDRMRQGSGLK
jgi:WD40 repeat protein